MTVLGIDPASRLPRLARRAVAAADDARLPEAFEYASRWLTLATELPAEELMTQHAEDTLQVLAVLVQIDRNAESQTLARYALSGLAEPCPARESLELFEDATDIFHGDRYWHDVPSARDAFDSPRVTGSPLDIVHAAVRSAWACLDNDDPGGACRHTRAAMDALPCPASWPILILVHVFALVANNQLEDLAGLRAGELDNVQWHSRLRTHPAFLSGRVVLAESTMRAALLDVSSLSAGAGAPQEARDLGQIFAAVFAAASSSVPIDVDPVRGRTRRVRQGIALAEAMGRAAQGDVAGARAGLDQAFSEPGSATWVPMALAITPWAMVEPILKVAAATPEDHPGRRILAVADYPVHRGVRGHC